MDRGHVGLDGLGPGLHVAKVLQGRVEAVDQLQPVGSLENKIVHCNASFIHKVY